ncbi:hypothetical protein L1887_37819 [Cichorium endivia]|nr:hypothetical protein L1887_37819 [Cichorium endivia]
MPRHMAECLTKKVKVDRFLFFRVKVDCFFRVKLDRLALHKPAHQFNRWIRKKRGRGKEGNLLLRKIRFRSKSFLLRKIRKCPDCFTNCKCPNCFYANSESVPIAFTQIQSLNKKSEIASRTVSGPIRFRSKSFLLRKIRKKRGRGKKHT